MRLHKSKTPGKAASEPAKVLRENFRKIERREWSLWAAAFLVTFLLMIGLLSFFLPSAHLQEDEYSRSALLLRKRLGMKVLYMSGYTDSFIAGQGVLEPETHLLHKPFTEEVLIGKVREVLDSRKKAAPVPSGARASRDREPVPAK